MLIFYKAIDSSVLTEGFAIPLTYQKQLLSKLGFTLNRGEKRQIQILLDGQKFTATMTNIQFDEKKYPNHGDLLQIRYGRTSPLRYKLQEKYAHTHALLNEQEMVTGSRRITSLEEEKKEFLAIYSTPVPGELFFDCIANTEFKEETAELTALGERVAEGILDGTDESANILLRTRVCKVRHLTKTISQDLKIAYGFRCQICGQFIGEPYGSRLIRAHHIDYFVRSLNNNASNIMILCPNHHGIIHDQNPIFDFRSKTFRYPNGYVEGLRLNIHL
jgi:hypothetical protein